MQHISAGSQRSRPTASFAKPDPRSLQRREIEMRRQAAMEEFRTAEAQLQAHDSATSMLRSASQYKLSSQGITFNNNMQRSISSTHHAPAMPRTIPRPQLCIPGGTQTAWSVPESNSQYISMSPEDYLKAETNDYQRSSSFIRPRRLTAGSQLISPASSYQNDNSQPSSLLTTLTTPSSSLCSPDYFNLSQQSCDSQGGYMSRNSSVSGQLAGGMDMLKVRSNASYPASNFDAFLPFQMDDEQVETQSQAVSDGLTDRAGMSLLGLGTGTGAHSLRGSDDILIGVGAATAQFEMSISQPVVSVAMQRTESQQSSSSSGSNGSTQSAKERKESRRLQRHIENQKKVNLLPKDGAVSLYRRHSFSLSQEKQAIPKMPCKRREQQKLTCSHCSEYPDGFHGAHELRRHIDRAHSTKRKVWICQTPSTLGAHDELPQKPLHICKQCKNQKKYNVYYNAAAHIRRAHFNPRKLGRCARGEKREVRAGKAGGDKPSIDWLKTHGWIKEIEIEDPPLSGLSASVYGESTMPDDDLDLGILDEDVDEPGFQFNDLSYSFIGGGLAESSMLEIETTLDDDLFYPGTIYE